MELNSSHQIMKRDILIDYIRGGAMLLVIIEHCGLFQKEILAFHMPLFFILSGYIFKYKEEGGMNYKDVNLYEYAKKRFYRIMIPYFCFELISFLLAFIVHHLFHYFNLGNVYLNLDIRAALLDSITCVQTPSYMGIIPHLWFFPCIYTVDIFFMIIKKYIHINIIFIIISSLLISYGTQFLSFRLPFTIDIAFMGLFFLLIGYRFKYLISNVLCGKWGVLSVPVFFYLVYNNKHLFLMFINSYGNYLYAIPTACLGIYVFIFLVMIINREIQ